jgi:hypothetical protein
VARSRSFFPRVAARPLSSRSDPMAWSLKRQYLVEDADVTAVVSKKEVGARIRTSRCR